MRRCTAASTRLPTTRHPPCWPGPAQPNHSDPSTPLPAPRSTAQHSTAAPVAATGNLSAGGARLQGEGPAWKDTYEGGYSGAPHCSAGGCSVSVQVEGARVGREGWDGGAHTCADSRRHLACTSPQPAANPVHLVAGSEHGDLYVAQQAQRRPASSGNGAAGTDGGVVTQAQHASCRSGGGTVACRRGNQCGK